MDKWLFSIAFGKVAKRVATFVASVLIAGVAKSNLDKVGVNVAVDPTVLTGSIFGGLELARNYLKNKVGWKWL